MSLLLSAAACIVVVLFLVRSLVGGLLMLLPLVVGTVIWLLFVHLSGVEINSNVTTGMAIAMGVGIDANIYFLYRFREEFALLKDFQKALVEGFTKIGIGLLFSFGALIVGLWMLIPVPLYIGYIGYIMGLILLFCLLCSFIISPIIWSRFKPRFLFASKEEWKAVKKGARAQ